MDRTSPTLRECANPEVLASELAGFITHQIRNAVTAKSRASLLLSGGKSPVRLLQALTGCELEWPSVTVSLVDERWVPENHTDSNARLVKNHLLSKLKAPPTFCGLYAEPGSAADCLQMVEQRLRQTCPTPWDVVVLGMGEDAHFASLFPQMSGLDNALALDRTQWLTPALAPHAPTQRISLGLSVILQANHLVLSIQGERKRDILNICADKLDQMSSEADRQALFREQPIAALLHHARARLNVFWSPDTP